MGKFIVPYSRMQPDIETEWGSYENPYIPRTSYGTRWARGNDDPMLMVPGDLRGRGQYRVQPRQLGPSMPGALMGADPMALGGYELDDYDGATSYPGPGFQPGVHGVGNGMADYDYYLKSVQGVGAEMIPGVSNTTLLILGVIAVGLIAYFWSKSKTKRNPMSCRRGWSGRGSQRRAWVCSKRGRKSVRQGTSFTGKNRKLARKAREQTRDENGRFI